MLIISSGTIFWSIICTYVFLVDYDMKTNVSSTRLNFPQFGRFDTIGVQRLYELKIPADNEEGPYRITLRVYFPASTHAIKSIEMTTGEDQGDYVTLRRPDSLDRQSHSNDDDR